ncbi:MAG: DUF389 domain-containing protein [Bacteroidota bacterium]
MDNIFKETLSFFQDRFNLSREQEREDNVIADIKKGIEFRGINVWVLVFAIMVASVGLNVNSTAVVIGAMLISPLMGPIMGIGLGLGISDLAMIKKAATNLAVMVVISIVTSWVYFSLSPLHEAQSELLARTTPTIWDVFIAFFGGLAGIVAAASREKGNVVPGVAIATALMPPLCTAGFGLAIGNLNYFLGAFYLFSINTVFICFSTLLIVRFLGFHEVAFVSPVMKRRVRTAIAIFIIAMVLPSIYIARNLVIDTLNSKRVENYIKTAFDFSRTEVVKYELLRNGELQELEVSLMGEPLDENTIENLRNQLKSFELHHLELNVKQGPKSINAEDIKSQVLEEYLTRNLDSIRSKDAQIEYLKRQIIDLKSREFPADQISKEAYLFDKNVQKITIQEAIYYSPDGKPTDTLHLAVTAFEKKPKKDDIQRFEAWLKTRISADSVRVIAE